MMLVSVEIPDPIARSLFSDFTQSDRRALEMLALEGYRSSKLSRGQVGRLLGLGFAETERFLHEHDALLDLRPEELEEDAAALTKALCR